MKKYIFLSILAILIISACKSAPEPAPVEPPPPPPPPAVVEDIPPPVYEEPPPPPPPVDTYRRHSSGIILDGSVTYTVKSRDRLNTIARQHYNGDGSLYPLISMVSAGIRDIDRIYPGQRLTIPDANINLNDPIAREAINRHFENTARLEEQRGRRRTAALIRNHIK